MGPEAVRVPSPDRPIVHGTVRLSTSRVPQVGRPQKAEVLGTTLPTGTTLRVRPEVSDEQALADGRKPTLADGRKPSGKSEDAEVSGSVINMYRS
eukprot:39239-Prorocentrum_minimum.AAC.4